MNVVRLGRVAIGIVSLLTAYNAGAVSIAPTVETHGGGASVDSTLGMSDSLVTSGLDFRFPAGPTAQSAAIWSATTPSPDSSSTQQLALPNSIDGTAVIPTVPAFDSHSVLQSGRPLLGEMEFATWKSAGGTPVNTPEDWLFQMQLSQDSNYQPSEPESFLPVPEPASGIVLLLGLAGLAVRRKPIL